MKDKVEACTRIHTWYTYLDIVPFFQHVLCMYSRQQLSVMMRNATESHKYVHIIMLHCTGGFV